MSRRVLLAAALSVCGLVAALLSGGGDDAYRLRLEADDAAGLRKDFSVKIAGAPVGKVTDVRLGEDDRAVADLEIDPAQGPVGRDVSAAVRASNLLGEKYVDLRPGDPRDPAPSGTTIPRTRVSTATDLDDVLAVLRPDTRVALAAFLTGQGEALAGRGADLAAALQRMPVTLQDARRLVDGVAADTRTVGRLVERSDALVAALAPRRADLDRLVQDADAALAPLARRRKDLGAALVRAPGTVRQLRRSLVTLRRTAEPLGPAARGLEATAGPLHRVLADLPAFVEDARPTLRTAAAAAPDLARLGRRAAPVVRRLRPTVGQLRQTADAMAPVSTLLADAAPDVLGVMQGWARAIQNRDGAGHVFRVSVQLGQDVLNMIDRSVRPAARRPRPSRGNAGSGGGTRPPARPARPGPEPAPGRGPLPKLPPVRVPGLPPIQLPQLDGGDRPAADVAKPLLDFLLQP